MMIPVIENFLCTKCGGHLTYSDGLITDDSGDMIQGTFTCYTCDIQFPVINGIPRFVSADNYSGSFGFQWNIHRKTQLDSYTGIGISRERLFSVSGWSEQLEGEFILEAGSGAGRFTEILLTTGAQVYSFDYSNAVEANLANNGKDPHLVLFQGDLFHIPLRKSLFDKVLCLGVLQHTPDPAKAFRSLAEYVRPGGDLVIDVYTRSLNHFCQWKYLLRPLTKRVERELMYRIVSATIPKLIPTAKLLRKIAGRYGARLLPIVEYSHLGLPGSLNEQWAILDTFDMLTPVHDHPQTLTSVNRWFEELGFTDIEVAYGPNGIVGKGKKPVIDSNRSSS